MSQNLQTFTRAAHTLRNVAVRVPSDAWDNPSCCEGWTAREVAGHASWVLQNIAAGTGHTDRPEKRSEAEVAGDDPAATVCASVDACLAALDQPGSLHTVATTPFGEMPVDDFIGTIWVDPLTHAWTSPTPPGSVRHRRRDAAAAQAQLEPIADMMRSAGAFGPETDAAGDDAVARFVAFAGRRSVRG